MADISVLHGVELFAGLDEGLLGGIMAELREARYRRGDVLFSEGDEPTDLYVVVSGRIAIANKSIDGRESVVALFRDHPTLLWRVVEMLARRLRAMDEALADSVFLDVTGRTAKRLLELAGDSDEFVLPITQEELAGLVGASRERVNKAIASFIRLGWIEQIDRRYVITNRQQMEIRAR
jgi:CRP/FNR family cyclic AMP-dependent transcriptional regulator